MHFVYHNLNPPKIGEYLILIYLRDSSDSKPIRPMQRASKGEKKGKDESETNDETRVPIVILLYPISATANAPIRPKCKKKKKKKKKKSKPQVP